MSKITINEKEIDCTKDKATVAELKELGGIPEREAIYDEEGNALKDEDVVDTTRPRRLGAIGDWTRG
jgi:hypothetical protein